MTSILFVCYANICRSPMAEAVMTHLVREAGLSDSIALDSAGTHCPFPGDPPYQGTQRILTANGIQTFGTARRVTPNDLHAYDYVLAMDRRNIAAIERYYGTGSADVRLFLSFALDAGTLDFDEVGDPYPDGDYDATFAAVYAGCAALLAHLKTK